MTKINPILIKSFIDEINNFNDLGRDISTLSNKDKDFIVACSRIIQSNYQQTLPSDLQLDNDKFNDLAKSIISKLVDAQNDSTLSKVARTVQHFFAVGFDNKVIREVKKAAVNEQQITQILTKLKRYREQHPSERIDFADFLREQGLPSSELSNINFRQMSLFLKPVAKSGIPPYWGTDLFKNVDFKNIHFKDCDLEYLNLSGSTFENCTFENCNLKNAVLCEAAFRNVSFNNAYLQDALFDGSELKDVRFESAQLEYTNFYDCRLESVDFQSCKMAGANFFEAQVDEGKSCHLADCDLINCLLFETKKHFAISGGTPHTLTKPVVVLPWNNPKPGVMATRTNRSLKLADSLPLKFNYFPSKVDTALLDKQVKEQLDYIQSHPEEEKLSIPEAILRRTMETEKSRKENSEIYTLVSHAAKLAKATDAIMLPGGSDIEPEFYGQKKESKTRTDSDYRRSILEFGLIREAKEKGIPLMGICRGSQLGNIYYGGTLKQHVGGQLFSIQSYQTTPTREGQEQGIIKGIIKDEEFKGLVDHHQAIDKTGADLEKIIIHQKKGFFSKMEIPKALEGKKGAPLILTQFHPEFFGHSDSIHNQFANFVFSKKNKELITAFIGAADTQRKKKALREDLKLFPREKKLKKVGLPAEKPLRVEVETGAVKEATDIPDAPVSTTFAQKVHRLALAILSPFKYLIDSISDAWRRLTASKTEDASFVNQVATPIIQKTIDKYKLLAGKKDVTPSQEAWHLNLALLRSAYNETDDPEIKKQINFLINNYLDKAAPVRAWETKWLVNDFESNYQVHPHSNYYYHRTEFLKKLEFSAPYNKGLAFADSSPLILTETTELEHFFPLSFTVMGNDEKTWANAMAGTLAAHFSKHPNIGKGLEEELSSGILFDLTSQFEALMRTNGSPEAERQAKQQLSQIKDKLDATIDQSIKILSNQYPELKNSRYQRHKLKEYLKNNITTISRVQVEENLGGIKVLPVFSKLNKSALESKYSHFIDFIGHTGLALGAINMRRYAMNAHELRPDIQYAVRGDNALYFPKKTDLIETELAKRLTQKFASSDLMKEQPQIAILGHSTMQLLNGLMHKISEEKWNALNENPATRKIVQTTLYQIKEHLANAELQTNDFAKFAQYIELAHAEMAALLELARPYQAEDFPKIYQEQLKPIVPEGLQSSVKAGLGKTAVNLFAGMNAALMQQDPNVTRCYSKGLYYEQALVMGNNYKFDEMIDDPSVTKVDFYACQTNPNIEIDTDHHHYAHIDIASDVRKIMKKNEQSGTQHLTVAVDCTIDYLHSPQIKELLAQFEQEIKDGKLNFVFFHSGQKFDMLGMDNYFGSPFYMVNNGSAHWQPFNGLLENKVHQTDPLSQQWFCLSNEFAPTTVDTYRKQIFENTREIMKNLPKALIPNGTSSQKVRVSTFDEETEPCFIDLKIVGFGHQVRAFSMINYFYIKCDEYGIKAFRRPSFGFYHPNITLIAGEDGSTSLRINPGLDPKENAAILDYLNDVAHSWGYWISPAKK
ncbi:gamma-glutamyl-gamma-aminobutyrate hydrolase family protein [Candidatus Protochlamydia phocaeensis]|uniref:gamma-glutamyl-gamma-aminobutyrate hydrolase family protein n=1 Tax=Candidatus Protochlamydia phocaeensis TaxID=1414722 RepID=UPI0008389477|nr:gamma-glutamyl-gamma-aminobutyrate hydrolase family protein [Candidatus Protochlamydia phocaeensis]